MVPATAGYEVRVDGVSHAFPARDGSGQVIAVDNVELVVRPGEFVCLVGPSGCGKTTVLNMAAGLVAPTSGTVELNGRPAVQGNPKVGYLLARDTLLPWRTALNNVALPLELDKVPRAEAHRRARAHLVNVGLGDFVDAYPAELSHGMRQRVALARTMVREPGTILMDEPFSALDAETRMRLQGALLETWELQRSTVLFVTHDLAEAVALGDRVVVFSSRPGRILADFRIDLERPRNILALQEDNEFHAYYKEIWAIFRRELRV